MRTLICVLYYAFEVHGIIFRRACEWICRSAWQVRLFSTLAEMNAECLIGYFRSQLLLMFCFESPAKQRFSQIQYDYHIRTWFLDLDINAPWLWEKNVITASGKSTKKTMWRKVKASSGEAEKKLRCSCCSCWEGQGVFVIQVGSKQM